MLGQSALSLCFVFKSLHFILLFSDNLVILLGQSRISRFHRLNFLFYDINMHTCSFCNQRLMFLLKLVNNFLAIDCIFDMISCEDVFRSFGRDISSNTYGNSFRSTKTIKESQKRKDYSCSTILLAMRLHEIWYGFGIISRCLHGETKIRDKVTTLVPSLALLLEGMIFKEWSDEETTKEYHLG